MQLVNKALAHSSHSFPDSDSCLCMGLVHGLLPACCPVWTMKGDDFRKERRPSDTPHGIPCGAFNPIQLRRRVPLDGSIIPWTPPSWYWELCYQKKKRSEPLSTCRCSHQASSSPHVALLAIITTPKGQHHDPNFPVKQAQKE